MMWPGRGEQTGQADGDQTMEGGPPVLPPGAVGSPEALMPQHGEGALGEEGLLGQSHRW